MQYAVWAHRYKSHRWHYCQCQLASCCGNMSILSDEEVYAQFKEASRRQYERAWKQFRDAIPEWDFESAPPSEDQFINYFKFLREEKKYGSSTLWTLYSCINSILKRKYSVKLQEFPRLTMLIKGYDTDVKEKALIFEEAQIKMFMLGTMETSYWLVRQAMSIVALL